MTSSSSNATQCILGLDRSPRQWNELTSFEARVQIVQSESLGELTQGLYLHASGQWYVYYGLTSQNQTLLFSSTTNRRLTKPVDLSVPALIRLEIDPSNETLTCWRDEEFIGELNLADLNPEDALYHRTIASVRPAGSTATTTVRDIRVAR